jgi:hypothetical protein
MPPVTTVTNVSEALLVSATAALANFLSYLPGLIGAILLLIIGWFLSGLVASLLERGLKAIGFERAVSRSGIDEFLARANTSWTPSRVIAELVKWFIRLIFVQAAASLLGMPQVTEVINSIVFFIPNVIVAMLILVVGALIGNALANIVRSSATEVGLNKPGMLATVTRYAVIGFAIVAAVDQLGIAETVVYTLLIGLVGALALALGLAFGLGGRDVAAQITQKWYDDSRQATRKVQAHLQAADGGARVAPPAAQRTITTPPPQNPRGPQTI